VTLGERWASALRAYLAGLEFDGVHPVPLPPQCSDGIDNDGDGRIDADDPGCADAADLDEHSPELACDDGIDNDGDGFVDAADPNCTSPSRNSERPPRTCGVGSELLVVLAAIARRGAAIRRSRAPRSGRETSPRSR